MEIPSGSGGLRNDPMFSEAVSIVKRLREAGFSAYIVGGAVRDMVLGKRPKDIDITTSAVPDEIVRLFPHSVMTGAAFGVVTVVSDAMTFEVATYREERDYCDGRRPEKIRFSATPGEDVSRRDFTVNALLFDPGTDSVIDLVGGLGDLRRGVLRTVGDPFTRFSEDYLRMLRAIRFAVRFGLEPDPALCSAISGLSGKLSLLSAERVRDELDRMLTGVHPEKAFRLMSGFGILSAILPEIEALRGVEQVPEFHPEGDVFEHTMLMLSHIAVPGSALAWSVLLHDVGKPGTRRVIDGRARFYSHDEKGAVLAEAVLTRLKMPSRATRSIVSAVANHMRFSHVGAMRPAKWRRLIADPNFPLELELHRIDCISCHGKLDNYVLLLDRMAELAASGARALPPPLVGGDDLLRLGMRPSPGLGKLLRRLADLQLEGAFSTREEALAEAARLVSSSL